MADSLRECADDYTKVVHGGDKFRVIECVGELQWVIQKRRQTIQSGGAAWGGRYYCLTRNALTRLYQKPTGTEVHELNRLPEHFRPDAYLVMNSVAEREVQ